MNPTSEPSQGRKPRLALLIATGFGLGRLPVAPGTWGSLGGVALYVFVWYLALSMGMVVSFFAISVVPVLGILLTAIIGLRTAGRAALYAGTRDPQNVVIDEISGQVLSFAGLGLVPEPSWKYLVLGFILFRAFDIWKPFPARQAERLPGGWGIMADDWVAGVYAALGLWAARAMGL